VYLNRTTPAETIGGGFVDPQGFNSAPPNPTPEIPVVLAAQLGAGSTGGSAPKSLNAPTVPAVTAAANKTGRALLQAPASKLTSSSNLNVDLPLKTNVNSNFVVPLKVMMGISSSFLAQITTPEKQARMELTGTEDLDYWNQVRVSLSEVICTAYSSYGCCTATWCGSGTNNHAAPFTDMIITPIQTRYIVCLTCRSTLQASASRLPAAVARTILLLPSQTHSPP
jgi:hypothetical protein